MTQHWPRFRKTIRNAVLAAGLLGCGTLHSCFANFADYQALITSGGSAVIQGVSDSTFGEVGSDFDTVVRTPMTKFLQTVWANWVDSRLPDDLPNNPIIKR